MLWTLTLLTAQADGLDLGVGVRNSTREESLVEGGRLVARKNIGLWSGELALYGSPHTERIPSLEQAVVEIINIHPNENGIHRDVAVDRFSAAGMLTHHLLPHGEGLSCGPAVYLGAELAQQQQYRVFPLDNSDPVRARGTRWVAAPMAGVGIEVQQESIAARLAVVDRVRLLDDGPTHEATATLDVMWRLR